MKENAKTYFCSKLDKLVKNFPDTRILYYNDAFTDEHLIKIFPKSVFLNNSKLEEFQIEFMDEFIDKFPNASLIFFTEDDWIDINGEAIEYIGNKYIKESTFLNDIEFKNSILDFFVSNDNVEMDIVDMDFLEFSSKTSYSKNRNQNVNYYSLEQENITKEKVIIDSNSFLYQNLENIGIEFNDVEQPNYALAA